MRHFAGAAISFRTNTEQDSQPRHGLIVTAAFLILLVGNFAKAQAWKPWRTTTPRDTFSIKADQFEPWTKGPYAPSCVSTKFYFSGTFGIFSTNDSGNFDARYLYRDASWAAPLPLPNPPSWKASNGVTTSFPVYLQISNNGSEPQDGDSLQVLEKSYQSSHQYTAIYPGAGTYFYFRIYNRLDQRPDGYYYGVASGAITVRSAQYTAGISIQSSSLTFPTTNVGQASHLVDSIASFGLDPLQVDSVWIAGPQAADFSLTSERGSRFDLDSVAANEFVVTYAPSTPQVTSTAWLYLHCPNAECGEIVDSIALSGFSAAPNGKIGPDTLDFGIIRAGSYANLAAKAYNSGNAPYIIESINIVPGNGVFSYSTQVPDQINGPGQGPIWFTFHPLSSSPTQATAYISDNEGNTIPIVLIGNGAKPNVVATDSTLLFDTLFTGGTQVLYDTIVNTGNWTARIDTVALGCANPNWFTFDPPDTSFLLDAGASRIYKITFHPQTTIDASLEACLEFFFDDGSQPLQIHLNGVEKQKQVVYDTNVVDFGRVGIGTSASKILGVRNLSLYPIVPVSKYLDSAGIIFSWIFPGAFMPDSVNKLDLIFTPRVRGEILRTLYIGCSNGQFDSIKLYGFGALIAPVITPPILDFGTVKDGFTTGRSTTISDTGDVPLTIDSLKIVGPDASEFTLVSHPTLPYIVPDSGQGSLNLVVNFVTNAHAGRLHTATLEIYYSDGRMDTVPLRAHEASNAVQFCWGAVDFGTIRVGTSKDTGVCFSNPEYIPLTVNSIWITPAGAPFISQSDSLVVPKSGQNYDSVSFRPVARGTFTAMLHAGGPGQGMVEDSIPITGIGAQSVPVLSSHLINFGKQTLLVTSNVQSLTLSDSGDWALVANIEKIGDPNNEFKVLLPSGNLVDPTAIDSIGIGEQSNYSLTFTPKFPKLPYHEAWLVFHYDDGSVDTVTLIGKDRSDFLSFSRDTINFGTVRIGAAPASATVNLINTSDTALIATSVSKPTPPPFTVSLNVPATVPSDDSTVILVTFSPKAIGPVSAVIAGMGMPFQAAMSDSVVLEGIGAAPAPKLSVDTLFFDTVAWGRAIVRNFTLSNAGNWPLVAHCNGVFPNYYQNDFTTAIPDTTLPSDSSVTYPVTFKASTPLQVGPRVDSITWTMDDGSEFKLVLVAYDQPPFRVDIGFPHAYWGRPGDKVYAELDLQNAVPDSLDIDTLNGTVTWDPSVVNLNLYGPGDSSIHPSFSYIGPGKLEYGLRSDSILTHPKTLINFQFQFHTNLEDGASSPLIDSPSLPGITDAYAPVEVTTIFLDSVCGTIHLIAGGQPIANFIEQNVPNPFGGAASTTTLPFNVDADNTIVTIRLLDPTGREILRPVDHQPFARGRFETTIDASQLPAGIYFYEFQANGEAPQMLKMAKE